MTDKQFEALSKLRGARKQSRTYAALRDVFVNGLTQKQAYTKHGIEKSTLGKSVWAFRKSLAPCITVVCGEEVAPPKAREGGEFTPQDPMRGLTHE